MEFAYLARVKMARLAALSIIYMDINMVTRSLFIKKAMAPMTKRRVLRTKK